MSAPTFQAPTAFAAEHPTALAIYCSDGRFTRAVEELLSHLGHARLDTLTLPGGPALLAPWAAAYSDREALGRAADFLIRKHGITHIVLLAHESCGYYRDRFGAGTATEMHLRQVKDLREARSALAASHHRVAVRLFFARIHGDRVGFEEV